MSKVSVIVPVYKVEMYLMQCIDSKNNILGKIFSLQRVDKAGKCKQIIKVLGLKITFAVN